MKKLFLAWQDPNKRDWLPVGRLTYEKNVYCFVYTKGAKNSENFIPFSGMQKLDSVYESSEPFPILSNRLLSSSRSDYSDFISWLNIEDGKENTLQILSLTGGIRKTDNIEIFPCPEPNIEGGYEVQFFCRGLSHLTKETWKNVDSLKIGDRLYLLKDLQNPFEENALALRTDDPATIVGYCPRYFNKDFNLMLDKCGVNSVHVVVERLNLNAPLQLRLLCKLQSPWPKNFNPCSDELYEPMPASAKNAESECLFT